MPKKQTENTCHICHKVFADGNVVLKYHLWNAKEGEADKALIGHLACVLHLPKSEPPRNEPKKAGQVT
jgi:hypothetical protein